MAHDFSGTVSPPSEETLILAIRKKDRNAFSYLYDTYAALLFGAIKKKVVFQPDAEIVLEKVFEKIWSHSHSYHSNNERIFIWMLRMVNEETTIYLRGYADKNNKN